VGIALGDLFGVCSFAYWLVDGMTHFLLLMQHGFGAGTVPRGTPDHLHTLFRKS